MKNLLRSPAARRMLTVLAISAISTSLYFTSVNAEEPKHQTTSSQFIDILPTVTTAEDPQAPLPADTTHDVVRLTPDKSEIIKLEEDVSSIIVGNPAHLSVLADTPSTLVLVPKAVGATHFSALNKKGDILMQRHVIVAGPADDYIRIKKTCANNARGCQQTSVYYCPDTCHEISPQNTNSGRRF